jgi:hypothetical protein
MKKLKHLVAISLIALLTFSCTKDETQVVNNYGLTHYLGENYLGGVVFHVYKGSDGLEHGLVVALSESGSLAWQNTPTLVNANRSWDGAYNTALMTGSPVANYINTLGTGWYLPSSDELVLLYNNRYNVNQTLNANAKTLLNGGYWSSTEIDTNYAHILNLNLGNEIYIPKTSTYPDIIARGVKAF